MLPVGLALLGGLLALTALMLGWRRGAAILLSLTLCLLWVCSMPLTASLSYGRLESRFPPRPLAAIPPTQCVVVLGGAVGAPMPPRQDIELIEAVDRVYKAAQLYRAGKASRVFVAAGNQPWAQPGPSEAALIGELLVEWGVPADAIQLEGRSRNTRENAVNVKPLLVAGDCGVPLLVTSAAHMPRAVASFAAIGVDVFPVTADVRIVHAPELTVFDFLPSAEALALTSAAMREWLGSEIYEWRGWN